MGNRKDHQETIRILFSRSDVFTWLQSGPNRGIIYIRSNSDYWVSDAVLSIGSYSCDYEGLPFSAQSIEQLLALLKEDTTGQDAGKIEIQIVGSAGNEMLYQSSYIRLRSGNHNQLLVRLEDLVFPKAVVEKGFAIEKLYDLYEETNRIARIGGWESNLITGELTWTSATKEIHEVPQDYIPELNAAIEFFIEGWSRNKVIEIFERAIHQGIAFDEELMIKTANGREIWVRSIGKPEMQDGKCIRVSGVFQDIDHKKRQERILNLEQKRFASVFNSSAIGIIVTDEKDVLKMANPASLAILGLEEDDQEYVMYYLRYRELIHPDDRKMAQSYNDTLLTGRCDGYTAEFRFLKANNDIIWCRLHSNLVNHSEETLIITQFEDITRAKHLERLSAENSRRFKGAFEHSPNGMALIDLQGRYLHVNDAMTRILGYTQDEFHELTADKITHIEDRDTDHLQKKDILMGKTESYTVEKRFVHKSRATVYGLLNVALLQADKGSDPYFIMQINDITQRVIAEKQQQASLRDLENLMRATTEVSIVQVDQQGIIVKFNRGAERLLGYSAEEVVGKAHISIVHDPAEIVQREEEFARSGQNFKGFDAVTHKAQQGKHESREWTFIRKNGARVPVHLVITTVRDENDNIVGYLGISTNISRFKQLEASLNGARIKAEEANRSKSEFLANMSHEIRTPLNGVIGFTDLLMKTDLDVTQRNYTQLANNAAHTLLALINDILDFSKIEAGKLELAVESTDLAELSVSAIDIIKHQAFSKGLELLLYISPKVNRHVTADPVRLRQIIINLLGNAVKFTQSGEVELRLDASDIDAEGYQTFKFSIRDTGIGIATKNLKKIFEAFDQEDASTTRRFGGSGLGITISNKLLRMMGSNLQVESTQGQGSTFYFEIHCRADLHDKRKRLAAPEVRKVLLVDDNPNNLLILQDMLAIGNIESRTASNGIEAIELLGDTNNFDFAIIDFNMPYMTGIDLIRHIREEMNIPSSELRLMLLHSTINDGELIAACSELDVEYNIAKPITSEQLYYLLNTLGRSTKLPENGTPQDILAEFEKHSCIILVAEDNPLNQVLTRTLVQKILPNAQIIMAEDGAQAVNCYMRQKPDLILMDIQMPVQSGLEATQKIRKMEDTGQNVPIIALTARALKGEKEECIQAGMNDYLTKPIIFEHFKDMLGRYLFSGN